MEIGIAQHMRNQVEMALDQVRPALIADGGNVEVAAVDEGGTVSLLFQGACASCPSQRATLRLLLEPLLKQRIPGITKIIPVASEGA